MSSGLYSGASGLALGTGLYKGVSGLWSGASGLIAGFGGSVFTPASLFAAGESGYWLDPSDFTTMWQNSTGTTPVTATGQTVGLILDKSIGTRTQVFDDANVTFTGATGYAGRVSPGVYEYARDASLNGQVIFGGLTAGKTYLVSLQISAYAGAIPGIVGNRADYISALNVATRPFTNTAGTYTFFYLADGGYFLIRAGGAPNGGTISNVSILEVPGNHFLQATAGNRPILGVEPAGGRRNLLTYTEQFDNAAWVLQAAGTGVVPTRTLGAGTSPAGVTACRLQFSLGGGTTTSDQSIFRQSATVPSGAGVFSAWLRSTDGVSSYVMQLTDPSGNGQNITVTGAWQRFEVTGTSVGSAVNYQLRLRGGQSPANSNTADVLFSEPQVETGSTATAYQRVTDQWNVTQAGVPDCYYLSFDGTDDWLQSAATVNPGAVDKAQVFAGMRKLSDATAAMLVEASAAYSVNAGSFALTAPDSAGGSRAYAMNSRGSASPSVDQRSSVTGVGAAPDTAVIAGLGDISGDSVIIRRNGTSFTAGTGDQGTGNFLTYTHYIGRRGGTTLPFNGRVYQTVMRYGPNLTADQIDDTEAFVAIKTGFFAPQITGVPTIS